ncbi:MAG: GLPGLI family protein [Marinirhabdus sp.]
MKFLCSTALLLFSISTFAQNLSGQAYYESKTTVDMENFGGREMSDQMKKTIAERMKSALEKTYILTFNNNESIYKEEEKLEAGGGGGFGMMMGSFSAGAQYKNLKDNQILEEREFFGKKFLINDTITNLQWEVGKESKMIGQYLAIKATAVKKVDENDFSMARPRPRRNDDKKEEKTENKDQKDGATAKGTDAEKTPDDPTDNIIVPKEVIVTAWFTPQIPVKNGPGEYAGLPGLILELNAHRTTVLCSKIVMPSKQADNIEKPEQGEEVSRAEYNKTIKEKMDEMRENFRGRGGRGRGRRGGM